MKKVILCICFLFLFTPVVLFAQENKSPLVDCMSLMSRIQSYLEFYYMSTGDYPRTLEDLDSIFNSDIKKESDKILFPKDPASGKDFVYSSSKDLKSYKLSVPDASLYGTDKIELSSVPWAWMDQVARRISSVAKTDLCSKYMSGLIMAVKSFQEKEKKLPSDIKQLVPDYVKGLPLCPKCGKPYTIELRKDDLLVSCPEPSVHGYSIFQCSLKKGFIAKPMEEKK